MAMLLLVYTLNFVDRQIIGILAVPIKADLGLSDAQLGLMGGLEIVRNKATREAYDYEAHIGDHCSAEALKRGLAFRANGDTMSLMPPLVITTEQLDTVFDIAREALDATAKHFGVI